MQQDMGPCRVLSEIEELTVTVLTGIVLNIPGIYTVDSRYSSSLKYSHLNTPAINFGLARIAS